MSNYEVEHNIPSQPTTNPSSHHRRRPSFTSFFSAASELDTSTPSHANPHSIPAPAEISAAYRHLAQAFEMMRGGDVGAYTQTLPPSDGGDGGAQGTGHGQGQGQAGGDAVNELLGRLVSELLANAEHPPREVQGVPQEFLDGLERVDKRQIKQEDSCPICGNAFLEEKYPLVVRLPCDTRHVFDLECISPWLKLNSTCPLDRKDLLKKKEVPKPPPEEEEEEWDDMYA